MLYVPMPCTMPALATALWVQGSAANFQWKWCTVPLSLMSTDTFHAQLSVAGPQTSFTAVCVPPLFLSCTKQHSFDTLQPPEYFIHLAISGRLVGDWLDCWPTTAAKHASQAYIVESGYPLLDQLFEPETLQLRCWDA